MRTYSELIKMDSYEERFRYLMLRGTIGRETFGFDRFLNQVFYQSSEWRQVRRDVILRDEGCDLGLPDCPIFGRVMIHHMNPITPEDIEKRAPYILDPEYLICVSKDTHNAIHYGNEDILQHRNPIIREPNDTCPWKN